MAHQRPNAPLARRNRRRGNALVEMTFVGIPIMFVLISIFEMSRGMWMYTTLAYAMKDAARYASVHGLDCSNTPNACAITVGDIAQRIRLAGAGLDPNQLQVAITCTDPNVSFPTTFQTITAIQGSTDPFPVSPCNGQQQPFWIVGQVPFNSALALFWPGARSVQFGKFIFPASAGDTVQF